MVDINVVKEVRDRSNVSLALCKKAAEQADGNIEEALVLLQKWGHADAAKKASNEAKQGRILSYIHHSGNVGVLLEVNCQTDFAANTDQFTEFANDIAMQIAATSPKFVCRGEIDQDELKKMEEIFKEQIQNMKRVPPERAWDKIVEGKFKKWYSEVCLLDQKSVIHEGKEISDTLAELVSKIGENVVIRRFVRWEIGEG